MNKKINLIISSGVIGAYLALELLKKKEKVVVTTRAIKKKIKNYDYLKIQKKVNFDCFIFFVKVFCCYQFKKNIKKYKNIIIYRADSFCSFICSCR